MTKVHYILGEVIGGMRTKCECWIRSDDGIDNWKNVKDYDGDNGDDIEDLNNIKYIHYNHTWNKELCIYDPKPKQFDKALEPAKFLETSSYHALVLCIFLAYVDFTWYY